MMSVASTTRVVTNPMAAVRLIRLVAGYSATAVAMQDAAVMTSSHDPHSTAVLLSVPLMKPEGSSMRPAKSFNCGIEAANETRYAMPPASATLRIGLIARKRFPLTGCVSRGAVGVAVVMTVSLVVIS